MAHFLSSAGPAISAPDSDGIVQVGEFPPTSEQRAIILAARDQTNNLIINALAGAAKTSTLVMIANQPKMKNISTLCLAFNKRIADELRERLPSNCQPMTLNSLGHRTWQSHLGIRCRPSTRKNFEVLKELIDEEPQHVKNKLYEEFSELMKALQFGKQYGWVPDRYAKEPTWRGIDDETFFSHGLPEALASPESEEMVKRAYSKCLDLAFKGEIDFDEQLLMPTCFGARFPNYPLTMIDESQDLSALNHKMLELIVGSKRLFAVGDPCQPDGTMITIIREKGNRWHEPKLEQVPIEKVKEGDAILGYDSCGSFMYNRTVKGITRKLFDGELVSITGRGIYSRYTPNHHCYANFVGLRDKFAVYLMQKGTRFRIGRCKMDYGNMGSGPIVRARHEEADALWILSVWEADTSAAMAEALVQAQFGIPDLTFIEGNPNGFATQSFLDEFWEQADRLDLFKRAVECLNYHKREVNYPLWTPKSTYSSLKRPCVVHACNLITGVSVLPYRNIKNVGRDDWQEVDVGYEPYTGNVTSFTISDNHLYVADNVVTHNCQAIYGFRGAHASSMSLLKEKFDMEELTLTTTFRCPH